MATYTPAPLAPELTLTDMTQNDDVEAPASRERAVDLDTVEMTAEEVREVLRRGLRDRKAARKETAP